MLLLLVEVSCNARWGWYHPSIIGMESLIGLPKTWMAGVLFEVQNCCGIAL